MKTKIISGLTKSIILINILIVFDFSLFAQTQYGLISLEDDIFENIEDELKLSNEEIKQNPENVEALLKRARIQYLKNEFELAIIDFTKLIDINDSLMEFYFYRGVNYLMINNFEKSYSDFNHIIEFDKHNKETLLLGYFGLGNLYYELQDYSKAHLYYAKATLIDPLNVWIIYNIGELYYNEEQYSKSIEFFNSVLKIDSSHIESYIYRSMAHYNLERYDLALEDINKAILISYEEKTLRERKNKSVSYGNRGLIKQRTKDIEGARNDYKKAIELDENNAHAFFNYGNLKYNEEDYTGALNDYLQSIYLDETIPAHNNIGNTYWKLNNNESACKHWNIAKQLGYLQSVNLYNKYCE